MGEGGKNTGVGCHSLLQEVVLTQGLNPGLLHCRQTLYHLSHQGSQDDRLGGPKLDPNNDLKPSWAKIVLGELQRPVQKKTQLNLTGKSKKTYDFSCITLSPGLAQLNNKPLQPHVPLCSKRRTRRLHCQGLPQSLLLRNPTAFTDENPSFWSYHEPKVPYLTGTRTIISAPTTSAMHYHPADIQQILGIWCQQMLTGPRTPMCL